MVKTAEMGEEVRMISNIFDHEPVNIISHKIGPLPYVARGLYRKTPTNEGI